jgi:hypothetical protein
MTIIYVGKGVDGGVAFGFYEDAEGTKRIENFELDSWKVKYYEFKYVTSDENKLDVNFKIVSTDDAPAEGTENWDPLMINNEIVLNQHVEIAFTEHLPSLMYGRIQIVSNPGEPPQVIPIRIDFTDEDFSQGFGLDPNDLDPNVVYNNVIYNSGTKFPDGFEIPDIFIYSEADKFDLENGLMLRNIQPSVATYLDEIKEMEADEDFNPLPYPSRLDESTKENIKEELNDLNLTQNKTSVILYGVDWYTVYSYEFDKLVFIVYGDETLKQRLEVDGVSLSEILLKENTFIVYSKVKNNASLPQIIPGCTDSNATNYLSNANEDDGSCVYDNDNNDNNDNDNNNNDAKWYLVNNSSGLKEDFLQNAQLEQTNQYKELFRLKSDGIEANKQIEQSDWVKISETGEVHEWNDQQWNKTDDQEGVKDQEGNDHSLKQVPYWVYGRKKSFNGNDEVIDIYVSAGNMNPGENSSFYNFYKDANGTEDLLSTEILDIRKQYKFHRLNRADTHPFMIEVDSDSEWSLKDDSGDDLNDSTGLTGDKTFTLVFDENIDNQQTTNVTFYCVKHENMTGILRFQ